MKTSFATVLTIAVLAATSTTASAQSGLKGKFQKFAQNNPGAASRIKNFARNNPGAVNRVKTFAQNNPGAANRVKNFVQNNPGAVNRVKNFAQNNPGAANRIKQVITNNRRPAVQPTPRPTKVQKAVRIAGAVSGVIGAIRSNQPQVIAAQPTPTFVQSTPVVTQPTYTAPVTQTVVASNPVASVPSNVLPTNTLPAQTFQITVLNPEENAAPVSFNLDGETVSLEPGFLTTVEVTEKTLVEFDRGGDFGGAKYKLENGTYKFKVTGDKGWQLFEVDEANAVATN